MDTISVATAPTTAATVTETRPARLRLLIVALVAGLLATLLAVAAPAEARRSLPARTATENSIDWRILSLINIQRVSNGVAPLRMNWTLQQSARTHNVTMSRFNAMSHQLPGEPVFSRRMSSAGYKWSWAGENIGWNSSMTLGGVIVLQNLMYNEVAPNDGHRQNILNPQFRDVGVDVYMDQAHHKVWLTTDFGRH